MSEKQGKGICMFVYNNEQLDYTKSSIIAALYAKRNMNNIPPLYRRRRNTRLDKTVS